MASVEEEKYNKNDPVVFFPPVQCPVSFQAPTNKRAITNWTNNPPLTTPGHILIHTHTHIYIYI